jgi:dTDP-4-dehydrorhamnose reductase
MFEDRRAANTMTERVQHIVVTGAGGLLGAPLCRLLAARPDVRLVGLPHEQLDITDEPFLHARLAEMRPDLIINCAAYTKVDDCEQNETLAMRVNAVAAGVVADAARRIGARIVHLSTDYVFSGDKSTPYTENDPPGPNDALSAYGRSKLEGEQRVMTAGGDWLIVRTSWLFGAGRPNFVATILDLARSRPEIRVVNDQHGRPTYAPDLAAAILDLLDRGAGGLVHVANRDACTWHEFACEIVRQAGLNTPIHPCTTADFPRPARRPANSVLDTGLFERITGRPLRPWRDALTAFLRGDGGA